MSLIGLQYDLAIGPREEPSQVRIAPHIMGILARSDLGMRVLQQKIELDTIYV